MTQTEKSRRTNDLRNRVAAPKLLELRRLVAATTLSIPVPAALEGRPVWKRSSISVVGQFEIHAGFAAPHSGHRSGLARRS
jgi:hypothetical protein